MLTQGQSPRSGERTAAAAACCVFLIAFAFVAMATSEMTPQAAHRIRKLAEGHLGRRYGESVDGVRLDCSGLVYVVYRELNYCLPRSSHGQSRAGRPVNKGEIQAGDILLFSKNRVSSRITHVAIATGDGGIIHASSSRGKIVLDPLRGRHYAERWRGARRIVGPESRDRCDD